MCGIVGLASSNEVNTKLANLINLKQSHRGPDDQGNLLSNCKRVSLEMSRLAILDIKHGHQPMVLKKERLSIIFNGEIFNSKNLRNFLIKNFNEKFITSHSDTEVILRLYKHKNIDAFKELNGMFSLIIFDENKDQIIFARDRFGIKPLLYKKINQSIVIASELQAITNTHTNLEIDYASIKEYINFGFISAPKTIYQGIKKLPQGNFGVFSLKSGSLVIKRWPGSNIEKTNDNKLLTDDNINEKIKNTLIQSIDRWKQSDEDVCYSLSSGIDSTSIVTLASKKQKISTFTVGFEKKYDQWNEFHTAKKISDFLKTDHTEIRVNIESFEEDVPKIISMFGEPYGGGLPSFNLFKAIKNKFKVIMTGIGGDELFGNYLRIDRYNNHINNKETQILNWQKYFEIINLNSDRNFDVKLLKNNVFNYNQNENHILFCDRILSKENQICNIDFNTQLPNDFLHMTDILSMNHSVEARTPFLDLEFVKLIMSIPINKRINSKNYKSLLINSIGNDFPNITEVVKKKCKMGFSLPLSILMREIMRTKFEKVMHPRFFLKSNLFSPNFYEDIIQAFLKGDNRYIELVWRVFILQIWLENGL